ncbi:MAG: (2Fe-2S)-binding protein [Planctomycetes bacterium]|nr:(2Fe-2S)-binding protein [Planctomycetota bacterium]
MTPPRSPAYLARLASPRGVGDLEPADLAGETGSVVGGRGVRVTLRLRGLLRHRVEAARFRPFGSPAALAPGSVLVERAEGAEVADLRALVAADLLAPLGAVPAAVERAAGDLAAALGRALDDGREAAKVSAPGVLVCRCLGVGDRVVRRAVRGGACDVPAISADCAAGSGCHSCWPDLRTILWEEREAAGREPARPAASDPLVAAVEAVVSPVWRAQGLHLRAARVEGGRVLVALERVEDGALASPLGGVALAQHALREVLGDAVRVELDGAAGPARS